MASSMGSVLANPDSTTPTPRCCIAVGANDSTPSKSIWNSANGTRKHHVSRARNTRSLPSASFGQREVVAEGTHSSTRPPAASSCGTFTATCKTTPESAARPA